MSYLRLILSTAKRETILLILSLALIAVILIRKQVVMQKAGEEQKPLPGLNWKNISES